MSDETFVSVKEAAQRLAVNEKTVRRWIRSGKLTAELGDGVYGQQYRVPVQALETAQTALSIVQVERQASPETLALAVAHAVEQAVSSSEARLMAELQGIRAELAALTSQVQPREPEPTPAMDSPVSIPPVPARARSWWQVWRRQSSPNSSTV